MNELPYSDTLGELLLGVHRALYYCLTEAKKNKVVSETDPILKTFFTSIEKKFKNSGIDKHISTGFYKTRTDLKPIPRISKLIVNSFYLVNPPERNQKKRGVNTQKKKPFEKSVILPSPFHLLYQILTVPNELQTSAYAFHSCRSLLFSFLEVHPFNRELEEGMPFSLFKEEDILKSISSFQKNARKRNRWPDTRSTRESFTTKIHLLNGHILSTKGLTNLWFQNFKNARDFLNISLSKSSLSDFKNIYSQSEYHFVLSEYYTELPDSSELLNWLFGIPVSIRGGDILFYGGLKKTNSNGLVISLSGNPGTGKTSIALSLSALLAPLNTTTIYLSLEEDKDDLITRLQTLIPDYLKELSAFEDKNPPAKGVKDKNKGIDWFRVHKIKKNLNIEDLTDIIEELKKEIKNSEERDYGDVITIPAICPKLVVIDNINEIFADSKFTSDDYAKLENFIDKCRSLGAIILLVSSEHVPKKIQLDYLVDVVIHLKQTGIENQFDKPIRILQLIKTRQQNSRQGSHVFHISNSKGFRISPQVPSQMDKREKLKRLLPSENKFIPALNIKSEGNKSTYEKYLNIATNSQILIHGYGSSGKAGLGMRLLLTPFEVELLKDAERKKNEIDDNIIYKVKGAPRNKVLIISFLYPEDYYEKIVGKIALQLKSTFMGYENCKMSYHVKSFYPGFLTPEDFVYKIVRLLDEAILEGDPYTGVLLDGLHNVFLQFKNLQDFHMVWPLLYSILSRYRLTVISTFTNFSFSKTLTGTQNHSQDDLVLMQQGQKPFLHGLVKAADYYLILEEEADKKKDYAKRYILQVRSSIGQNPPKDVLLWNRDESCIIKTIIAKDYFESDSN